MTRSAIALFVLLLAGLGSTHAATPYERPAGIADEKEPLISAGYRALFTCSGHFSAGRPLADILQLELADVSDPAYPAPVIDQRRHLVTATDPSGRIVRIAAWRDTMGCTILPPHWTMADVPRLPYVAFPPAPDVTAQPFPAGDKVDLPASGIDSRYASLGPVLDAAFDGRSFGTPGIVTTGVIVLKNGRIVAERYRPHFGIRSGYRTWSTAKSISAILIGIAASKGILDVEGRADIPEWSHPGDPRQAITYKHLLWMSSGLFSGGSNTNAIYFGGQDIVSAATKTHLEAEPGKRWKYANNDTLLLMHALRTRMKDDLAYLRFPYEELFHPIGMYQTRMEMDHLGNFIGSSQTYTTARDLARFGLLLAADGVWNGRRLVPEGWIRFLTSPAPAKAPASDDWGYGGQFWLLDGMPGIPRGTYTTAGNKGQYVTVVPGHDLVVVRTGIDPNGKRFDAHRLVAEVLKVIGK